MYTCLICYKEYKYERNLVRHIKEHHAGLESYDCTEENCNSTFIRRGYLFVHLTSIHGIEEELARTKSISTERRSNKSQKYYDDVSDDDTILDLINEAIGKERQTGVQFVSVDKFLESLNDEEINTAAATDGDDDGQTVDVNSFITDDAGGISSLDETSDHCGQDGGSTGDINNNESDIIVISDEDDDDINDEKSLVTIGNSTIQQTVILTFQRTLSTVDGQIFVSDINMEQDFYEHVIQ